jgi:hypothetical protein
VEIEDSEAEANCGVPEANDWRKHGREIFREILKLEFTEKLAHNPVNHRESHFRLVGAGYPLGRPALRVCMLQGLTEKFIFLQVLFI